MKPTIRAAARRLPLFIIVAAAFLWMLPAWITLAQWAHFGHLAFIVPLALMVVISWVLYVVLHHSTPPRARRAAVWTLGLLLFTAQVGILAFQGALAGQHLATWVGAAVVCVPVACLAAAAHLVVLINGEARNRPAVVWVEDEAHSALTENRADMLAAFARDGRKQGIIGGSRDGQ